MYYSQHTYWNYPPVDDHPVSGVHDADCKWLCAGGAEGMGLCRRTDHPECVLCQSADAKRAPVRGERRSG